MVYDSIWRETTKLTTNLSKACSLKIAMTLGVFAWPWASAQDGAFRQRPKKHLVDVSGHL